MGSGSRVSGLRLRVKGVGVGNAFLEFGVGVEGLGFRAWIYGTGLGVEGRGLRVEAMRFWFWFLSFWF